MRPPSPNPLIHGGRPARRFLNSPFGWRTAILRVAAHEELDFGKLFN